MKRVKLALGAAIAAGLGAIAATIWVGASVREDTVVEKPYEEGLRLDAEREARGALGLAVSLADGAPETDAAPLRFALADRAGRPVDDASVTVEATRTETSRDGRRAHARADGGGRYAADLAFPAPGAWDVRFDVVRGGDRVRIERRVVVRAACDLAAGACSRPLAGGGEVSLELSPRPLRTMRELGVRVTIGGGSTPTPTSTPTTVTVSFSMPGMEMGENRVALAAAGPNTWRGAAVLVACPSGRRDWIAEVSLPGAAKVRFPFRVAEER